MHSPEETLSILSVLSTISEKIFSVHVLSKPTHAVVLHDSLSF